MTTGERRTIIKINAITVPADAGDELARRFAARAGAVDGQEGFEGFERFNMEGARRRAHLRSLVTKSARATGGNKYFTLAAA